MTWLVHRGGKVFRARRKKMSWEVIRPDIGAPGRGKKVIKIKRKGILKKYGYSTKAPASVRHRALRKVDKIVGTPTLFKMINAQVIFRKRMPDGARRVFEEDREWILKNLMSEREARAMTEPARREWMSMTPEERALAMPERS